MNKVVLFLMAIVASISVEAQINTPAPSPSAKLMQTVGLTEVMIDYSRPNMRGREVYGNLVPFDKLWRTGANAYTKITFKDINKAKEWMNKAMSMTEKPAFWQLRQQSLILAKAGDKKGAIEAAKKSLAGATEAGNDDYIKMNNDSLKEWRSN